MSLTHPVSLCRPCFETRQDLVQDHRQIMHHLRHQTLQERVPREPMPSRRLHSRELRWGSPQSLRPRAKEYLRTTSTGYMCTFKDGDSNMACGWRCAHKDSVLRHIKSEHFGQDFVCNLCGVTFTFASSDALHRHMGEQHDAHQSLRPLPERFNVESSPEPNPNVRQTLCVLVCVL